MADRPYTLLSAACSLDGRLDDGSDTRLVLSTPADLDRVDALRAWSDAILVGARTVRRDDPRLLVRDDDRQAARTTDGRPGSPARVALSGSGDLDAEAAIFTTGDTERLVYAPAPVASSLQARLGGRAEVVPLGPAPRVAPAPTDGSGAVSGVTGESAPDAGPASRAVPADSLAMMVGAVLDDLGERGVRRLLVEGGGRLHTALLTAGLADELRLAIAPFFVGASVATRFAGEGSYPWHPGRRARLVDVEQIDDLAVLRYALSDRFEEDHP